MGFFCKYNYFTFASVAIIPHAVGTVICDTLDRHAGVCPIVTLAPQRSSAVERLQWIVSGGKTFTAGNDLIDWWAVAIERCDQARAGTVLIKFILMIYGEVLIHQ